jgi:hypothetical protein
MEYYKQVKDFLSKYCLTLTIKEAIPQKKPLWVSDRKTEDYGKNYWVSIKNKNGISYNFDFWGSIKDKYGNKKPNAYDVLACLDTLSDGETFESFCNSYGYDTDSILAEKTYKAVMKQIDGLKKILSKEAIEDLNNIQ